MLIQVNGIKIFYEKTGEGRPVILLHGNGESHKIFDVLVPELAKTHTVYALDSRSHGQSGKARPLRYRDMAEDVAAFIEALALVQPLLYGFSDGGIVGLIIAARYPALLGKLAVSGANIRPDGILPRVFWLMKVMHIFTRDDKLKLMLTQPDISHEELSRIAIPTLVLAGEKDLVPRGHTEEIARAIPGSILRVLPGESHASYVLHSPKLYGLLAPFFTE